jgi:micrococcal nuclease
MRLLAIAAVWALACSGAAQHVPVGAVLGPVRVLSVIDGDTIVVDSNLGPRTVRLIGIDAPEMRHPERGREPFGPEASAFVHELLPPGTMVWVETDAAIVDAYGRMLAYLYVPDVDGAWSIGDLPATQVSLAIAHAGYAEVMTIEPNRAYAHLYEAAVEAAKAAEVGMWSGSPHVITDWPVGPIIVWCALYDPSTPFDEDAEWVSVLLRVPLDTRGYYVWDAGSKTRFPLPSGLQQAGELRIGNPGRGVWNNGGDTIHLMFGNETVDAWDYTPHLVRDEETVICRDWQ